MEPTDTSKRPIRIRYLGHVTGYQPIRVQYLILIRPSLTWIIRVQIYIVREVPNESDSIISYLSPMALACPKIRAASSNLPCSSSLFFCSLNLTIIAWRSFSVEN
eukprot:sb/3477908/